MIDPPSDARPRLRQVDVHAILHNGQPSLYLRDPVQLSDLTVVVPQALGPLLGLIDGTRTAAALRAAFALRFGLNVGVEPIRQLLAALDQALLLDNGRARQAEVNALATYRAADARLSRLAGASYPGESDDLAALLDSYLAEVDDVAVARANQRPPALAIRPADHRPDHRTHAPADDGATDVRGVISPHIDFGRGGPTYARVWHRAAAAARAADLVVMLGTDHFGRHGALTLTRQNYRTPFGVLPTATGVVDTLAEALGEQNAFAGELNHRAEHSVELSAVWLHHMRGGSPVELVPVLCGSFGHFVGGAAGPEGDAAIAAFVAALRPATAGRRTLVVASADLSHVGPAFGGAPVDNAAATALVASDESLIVPTLTGDAGGYFDAVRAIGDRTNVCGTPPIYLLLRLLGPARGEVVAYDHCPADGEGASVVSVCGVVLG